MNEKIALYQYDDCGLSDVLIEGLHIEDDRGEEYVFIPNIHGLHRLICESLLHTNGKLKGEEIRFLRTEMGLTPKELAKLIDRNASEVKKLESEQNHFSVIDETYFRILAMEKLEISSKTNPGHLAECCKRKRRTTQLKLQALYTPQGEPVGEYRLLAPAA